ncbi:hypothetical protein [Coxiella burnetii]|uniref:hypothetical protein n=1 Tax=Coxiella burnetii TaxID=777 RepID=UPI0000DAEBD7|nr:hypothetical protein [Coxiella burnetii]MDE3400920.1 hypothetical protein [Coxiella burnetii]
MFKHHDPSIDTQEEQKSTEATPIGNSSGNISVQTQNRSNPSEGERRDDFIIPDLQDIVFHNMAIDVASIPTNPDPSISSNSVAFFVHRLTNWSNTVLPVFLDHVAKGNQAGVEEMLEKYGALLLLEKGQIETYARDLDDDPIIVERTALQIALGAGDEEIVEVIIHFLDEVDPNEKFRQYQAQFPVEEKRAESLREQTDLEALKKLSMTLVMPVIMLVNRCSIMKRTFLPMTRSPKHY